VFGDVFAQLVAGGCGPSRRVGLAVAAEYPAHLRERNCVRQDEHSDYVITGEGVDYVESHLPSNKLLYRLLKAAESGTTRATSKERDEEPDAP